MKWTGERPTEPGWYWVKDCGGSEIVELGEDGLFMPCGWECDLELDGDELWAGPLLPPASTKDAGK